MSTSADGLIDPSRFSLRSAALVPAAIERAASTLASTGSEVRDRTGAAGSHWAGIRAGYYATDQERLYTALRPVVDDGMTIEADLAAAADALDGLAQALVHTRMRLVDLEERARQFRAEVEGAVAVRALADPSAGMSSVAAPHWMADPELVDRNRGLLTEYRALEDAAIEESERCARALMRLAGDRDESSRPAKPAPETHVLINVENPLHQDLDVAGLLPIIGEPADVLNGLIYALEGDFDDAMISFAAVAPVVGSAGTVLRITSRLRNAMDAAALRATFRFATDRQVRSKFDRHASVFGITGNRNPQTLGQFTQAVTDHVNDPGTLAIVGTYRTEAAIHFVNPDTGINVLAYPDGRFWSVWQLGEDQLANVLSRGSL